MGSIYTSHYLFYKTNYCLFYICIALSNFYLMSIYDNNIIKIDSPIVLFIYANYKYNCPDGSADLNKIDDLPKPLEGYKYYFDKYNNSNIIRGLLLTLKINDNTT